MHGCLSPDPVLHSTYAETGGDLPGWRARFAGPGEIYLPLLRCVSRAVMHRQNAVSMGFFALTEGGADSVTPQLCGGKTLCRLRPPLVGESLPQRIEYAMLDWIITATAPGCSSLPSR
jgi:hypothetical protein